MALPRFSALMRRFLEPFCCSWLVLLGSPAAAPLLCINARELFALDLENIDLLVMPLARQRRAAPRLAGACERQARVFFWGQAAGLSK